VTKEQAVEKCARALVRRQGYNEEDWKNVPASIDFAKDVIACLEVLGLARLE
jgi:hypothetical protein